MPEHKVDKPIKAPGYKCKVADPKVKDPKSKKYMPKWKGGKIDVVDAEGYEEPESPKNSKPQDKR